MCENAKDLLVVEAEIQARAYVAAFQLIIQASDMLAENAVGNAHFAALKAMENSTRVVRGS